MSAQPQPPPGHPAALRALADLLAPPERLLTRDGDRAQPDAEHDAAGSPAPHPQPPDPGTAPHEQESAEQEQAQRLAIAGVEALGADSAAVLTVDAARGPRLFAGTDDAARGLCALEIGTGAGPALECSRASRTEVFEIASVGDRWRGWAEAAIGHGWDLAEVVPLSVRAHTVGGMVLLRRPGRHRADPGLVWAGILATAMASAVVHQRALAELQRRADQLQTALTTRVVIEQAKGVLAERGGLDVQTAFDRLRRYARAHRHRIADVAGQIVTGDIADDVLTHVRPDPEPPSILDP